jgi:hypothetical protein
MQTDMEDVKSTQGSGFRMSNLIGAWISINKFVSRASTGCLSMHSI